MVERSEKIILDIRNRIFVEQGIPALLKIGFIKQPFMSSWFGRNNLGDYTYEFGRLGENSTLQYVQIHISKGDRWVKIFLNVFTIEPRIESVTELKNFDSMKLKLPPFSLTEMRVGVDDIKGMPLFNWEFMFGGHRLKAFKTQKGLELQSNRLAKLLTRDLLNMDFYVRRWLKLHKPLVYSMKD